MKLREAISGMIPACYYPEIRSTFELAVVNGRTGERYLGRITPDGEYDFPTATVKKHNGTYDDLMNSDVYDWTHTDRTMLIIL